MKIIKRLLSFIFLCVIIAGGVLGYKGYEEYKKALSEESVKEMAARIEEQPNYTTIDELPQTYIDAVLSVEDKRFYDHFGVDPIAVGRAFFNDVKAGAYVEGGSTITQQLVRNTILSDEQFDHTVKRKVREAYIAIQMEKEYTKDQILNMYLNTIYYGNGAYGIEAASIIYFNKDASDLTLAEAATLIGLPQSPSYYDPTVHPEAAKERRSTVLDRMLEAEREELMFGDEEMTIVIGDPSHTARDEAEPKTETERSIDLAGSIGESLGSLWDPIPVTPTTYVSRPLLPRSVRTIDLAAPVASSELRVPVTAEQPGADDGPVQDELPRAVGE